MDGRWTRSALSLTDVIALIYLTLVAMRLSVTPIRVVRRATVIRSLLAGSLPGKTRRASYLPDLGVGNQRSGGRVQALTYCRLTIWLSPRRAK